MRRGLGAAFVALALLAIVCLLPAEAGCGCDELACGSDCPTPCCVASSAPFLAVAQGPPRVALLPMEPALEAPSAARSADPRDILHVPRAASS